jgi:tetratricopeptide (TPR) repeat protein
MNIDLQFPGGTDWPRSGNKLSRILVAICLGLLLFGCGAGTSTEKLTATGDKYFENGKYREASIIYRRAIQKDRMYGPAYYKLGLAEHRLGRYRPALSALTRAVELDPTNQDAYGRLADLYLAVYLYDKEKYESFLSDLQRITETAEQHFPDAFDINRVKAFVALAAEDYPRSLEYFQRASEQKPEDRRVSLGLVQSMASSGDVDQAVELSQAYVEEDPGFAAMYDFVYLQQVRREDLDGALATLQRKIESNENSLVYRLQLARHYLFVRDRLQMQAVLDELTGNPEKFPLAWSSVGQFYLRIREYDRAFDTFRKGSEADPDKSIDYRNKMVEVLAMQGKFDEAFQIVNETLESAPHDASAQALRGAIRLRSGNRAEIESATNDFEAALAGKPDNAVLRYNLAEAYRAQNQDDRAIVEYETSIRNRPDYLPPRYRLASLQIEQREFAKAVATAEEILKYSANNPRAQMIRATAWIQLGQLDQAKLSLTEMVTSNPDFRDPKVALAKLHLRDGKFGEAEALFRELFDSDPPDGRGLLGLADVYIMQGKAPQAVALLQQQLEEAPDSIALRVALGSTYLAARQYEEALTTLKEAESQRPNDGQITRLLGSAYYTMNDPTEAQRYLARASELLPSDPMPVLYLGMLAERQGAIQQAVGRYDQVIELAPDNVIALNNLAYILAETNTDMDRALTLIQKARGLAPRDPNVADTLGYIYIKKNLPDSALPLLNEVVSRHPGVVIWRYHLALALYQNGQGTEARKNLQTALQNRPSEEEKFKIEELMSQIGS